MFTHFGRVACFEREGFKPHVWRTREELGRIWIPAPTCVCFSKEEIGEGEEGRGEGNGRRERYFSYFRGGFENCYGVAC
jgi:hypothetical protein